MKYFSSFFQRHRSVTSPQVVVRPQLPWYWHLIWILILPFVGYALGYWQYVQSDVKILRERITHLEQENKFLHNQAIHLDRRQQIDNVAQKSLASDLKKLQEENVRLKEDIAFYKGILEESTGVAKVKFHNFRVSRSDQSAEYHYRLLLVQSGKHDKAVQGSLQLTVMGASSDGKPVLQGVLDGKSKGKVKVNFKYYQMFEGHFTLPKGVTTARLQAKFFQNGFSEPKLTQTVSITD